jgi:diguanylate cyclase (GGDEF)-like protein
MVSGSRFERWVVSRCGSAKRRATLAIGAGLLCAFVSLGICAAVYPLAGFSPRRADAAIAYGLPFILPLMLAPILLYQLLRLAGFLQVRQQELEEEIQRRRKVESRLAVLATTDDLTALINRRAFFAQAAEIAKMAPLTASTVAVLDLDGFKNLNDTYGHTAGDEALRKAGASLKGFLEGEGIAGRLGGDEFGIIVEGKSPKDAMVVFTLLRQAVESFGNGLTASIGVASWNPAEHIDQALARADHALYRAKQRGRNRIEVASDDDPAAQYGTDMGPVARR